MSSLKIVLMALLLSLIAACGGGGSASTPPPVTVPAVPTGVVATAGSGQVQLSWASSSGATSYVVSRSATATGTYADVATVDATNYTDMGLTNGTAYYYEISALNTAGRSSGSASVTATPDPAVPIPATPQQLSATPGDGTITLSWLQTPNATTYHVKRASASAGPYTEIAAPTMTSYTDTGLTNGVTYFYMVSAQDATGQGPNSDAVSATPDPIVQVPATPQNVTAVGTNGQVTVTWAVSSGAASYQVERSAISGGPYSVLSTAPTSPYIDTSVANGTTYYYVVVAQNSAGASAPSSEATGTPAATVPPPPVPTQMVANAGNAQVALTWGGSSDATNYNVQRSLQTGGPYTSIAAPLTPSYVDTGVQNGTTYYYVVSASRGALMSGNSTEVSATPTAPLPPGAPTQLTASVNNGQVTLSWTASSGATAYAVKRATQTGGPYSTISSPTGTGYTDTTVQAGVTYYYVVAATAGATLQSTNSSEVSAAIPAASVPPTVPAGLAAVAGNGLVALTWNASAGASGYVIARGLTTGGPFTAMATTAVPSYTDTSAQNDTTYYYVVAATAGGLQSEFCAPVPATAAAPPATPTGLTAHTADGSVTLNWNATAGALAYQVLRGTVAGIYGLPIRVSGTSYTDATATDGTTYYYAVQSVGSTGSSAPTPAISATPRAPLPAPGTPTASAGNSQVTLAWSASTGAVSYNVLRGTAVGTYAALASVTTLSYLDTTAQDGTTYFYVVQAVASDGTLSTDSAPTAATPAATLIAPTSLHASPGNGLVSLSWASSANATGYTVLRGTTAGSYVPVATGLVGTAYIDTTANNGTLYYYVVQADGASGNSPDSAPVTATPSAPPSTPSTPSATAGNGYVTLTWNITSGAQNYNVKRATTSGGPYTIIATTTTATYTDLTASNGTTYFYVVSALSATGVQSTDSPQASSMPVAPPAVPTGLKASAGNASVTLNWTASAGASSYNLLRGSVAGTYATTISVLTNSYSDTTVANGATYYYAVQAVGPTGSSTPSSAVSAAPAAPPLTPTGLTASGGNASVTLDWSASSGATGYVIYRGTSSGSYGTPVAVALNHYADATVTNGTTYFYAVAAVGTTGTSAKSAEVTVTPAAPPVPPATPTGVKASGGDGMITISWTPSTGAKTYTVQRALSASGPYSSLPIVTSPTVALADAGLNNGTTYYYRVAATGSGGSSSYSTPVSAAPMPAQPYVTGTVTVTVPAKPGATIGSDFVGLSYEKSRMVPYVSGTTDTWVFSGADSGLIAYMKQIGPSLLRIGGNSADYAIYNPLDLAATSDLSQITLTWTASPGATSYDILRTLAPPRPVAGQPVTAANQDSGYTKIASVLAPTTTYRDTTVTVNKVYDYAIVPVGGTNAAINISKINASAGAPPAPARLAASPGSSEVILAWPSITGAVVDSYQVWRGTAAGAETQLPVTIKPVAGTTTYTDTNVISGTTYFYMIKAVNTAGTSGVSNEVSAKPAATLTATTPSVSLTLQNIHPADIDNLAALLSATQWKVLYDIDFQYNMEVPSRAGDEAHYVSSKLGSSLYGFEIGNEPDYYHAYFPGGTYSLDQFLVQWATYDNAIVAQVPTAVLTGPLICCHYGDPSPLTWLQGFASAERNHFSVLTGHYYSTNPVRTMAGLLADDPNLKLYIGDLTSAAATYGTPGGVRMAEGNSFNNGGVSGVSNAYGSALWVIDFLFKSALDGSNGVNLHGGGDAFYTPIVDNGKVATGVRPEYYGMYLFSSTAQGTLLNATSTVSSTVNFSAYAVAQTGGGTAVMLNNKDPLNTVVVTVALASAATTATATVLANAGGVNDVTATGTTINGAQITAIAGWVPPAPGTLPVAPNATVSVSVPPASAIAIVAH